MQKHAQNQPLVISMVFVTAAGHNIITIWPFHSYNIRTRMLRLMSTTFNMPVKSLKNAWPRMAFWMSEMLLIYYRIWAYELKSSVFYKKGKSQLSVDDHDDSDMNRITTKIYWLVELVHCGTQVWKYFDKIQPNSQIPYVYIVVNTYFDLTYIQETQINSCCPQYCIIIILITYYIRKLKINSSKIFL